MDLKDLPLAEVRRDIAELKKLAASRGWQIIRSTLEQDHKRSISDMGNPSMTEAEMHFRRGAIYASTNMLRTPELILSSLEAHERLNRNSETPSQ